MTCKINVGYNKDDVCDDFAFGGVSGILLTNKEDWQAQDLLDFVYADECGTTGTSALYGSGTDYVVTDILEVADTKQFYNFDYETDSASYTEELTKPGANTYVNQTLQWSMSALKADETALLRNIALGKYIALVQRADLEWFILGLDSGEGLTAGDGGVVNTSGATKDEESTTVITLTGGNKGFARPVCADTVAALIAKM